MMKPARKIYDWAAKKARSKHSPLWLGVVFLLELILFIPLDTILMLFCMENPRKKYLYAAIATVASAISGVIGYFLGYILWDAIGSYVVGHLISENFFNNLVHHYNAHQSLAVFIGSILPIPFKAISLSAGACHVSFVPFVAFVLLARACRFFLAATLIHVWGDKIKGFIDRHFNRIIMAVGAKIALTFTFFWALGH
jgi:membrane protein YqaA with SNARE-associated domain